MSFHRPAQDNIRPPDSADLPTAWQGAIALSHELGHDKLHRGGTFNCSILEPRQCIKYRPELEANLFALNLLSYARDFDVDIIKKFLKQKNPSSEEVHNILKNIFDFYL